VGHAADNPETSVIDPVATVFRACIIVMDRARISVMDRARISVMARLVRAT
jgi:hypothetical protein